MAFSKILVGAHILCFINGRLFGECNSIQWQPQTPRIRRGGLDSLQAYELSPGPVELNGTIGVHRVRAAGGLEGRGIVAPPNLIPRERYFSILLVDRVTGQKVHQADFCMVESQTWSYAPHVIVGGSFSFKGIEWANEALYP